MKRLTIFVLVLVLIVSSTTAFAGTNPNGDRVESRIRAYEEMGFEIETLENVMNTTQVNMNYITSSGNTIEAEVTFVSKLNGDMEIVCVEPGATDTVLIKTNGDILINNEAVKITERVIVSNGTQNLIEPLAQRYNRVQEACPYGVASDYDDLIREVEKYIEFERDLQEYALTAIISALIEALIPGGVGLIAGTGVSVAMEYYADQTPYGQAISCKYRQYVHNVNGAYINGEYVYKFHVTFYRDENCTMMIPGGDEVFFNRIKTG